MSENSEHSLQQEEGNLHFLKRNLADFLTLSRVITGLIILSLSFVGKDAYIAVVILALIGGATDIYDGKAARRYLRENRQSKLGKYDAETDNFFVLCIIAYLSFSEIVIPKEVGLGWIGLVLMAIALSKGKAQISILFETAGVIALLIIAGLYNLRTFALIIAPAVIAGVLINHKRVLYLVFDYWPKLYSNWKLNIKP
ncbi:CDP-alcohol phosphatidyltransferase family protein [Chloroflexota bacterium]